MDETEIRIAALELIAMERLALEPPSILRALAEAINVRASGDEKVIRAQALQIIEDAANRHEPFNLGEVLKGPPKD